MLDGPFFFQQLDVVDQARRGPHVINGHLMGKSSTAEIVRI